MKNFSYALYKQIKLLVLYYLINCQNIHAITEREILQSLQNQHLKLNQKIVYKFQTSVTPLRQSGESKSIHCAPCHVRTTVKIVPPRSITNHDYLIDEEPFQRVVKTVVLTSVILSSCLACSGIILLYLKSQNNEN